MNLTLVKTLEVPWKDTNDYWDNDFEYYDFVDEVRESFKNNDLAKVHLTSGEAILTTYLNNHFGSCGCCSNHNISDVKKIEFFKENKNG